MSASPPRLHYGWVIVALAALVVAAALGLARFSYSLLLPPMQAGLGMANTQAGALATVEMVGYLATSLAAGLLAARTSPRRLVTAGLILAGAGMLLTAAARDVWMAGLGRVIVGMGSGASNVPVMGLMLAWFAPQRRGIASGLAVSGSLVAIIIVSPLVPRLIAAYPVDGWRLCWLLFGGITLGVALLAGLRLRDRPEEMGLAPVGAASTAGGAERGRGALAWGEVYRSRLVWHLGAVYATFGFSYIIYLTFFNKRLLAEGGYTPVAAGSLFMVFGWFSLGCGLLWGAISDAIGRRPALALVLAIHALAFTLFGLATAPAGFLVSTILFGLTAWSVPAIMAAFCGDTLSPRMVPAALGFITLFFGAGQALGPGVAGALADARGSFVPAYLLAAAIAAAGAAGALLLRPSPHKR